MLLLDDELRMRRETLESTSPLSLCWSKLHHFKKWSSLPHQHHIKAKPWQDCWLEPVSSEFPHNEHVIASWFQLEQDTDETAAWLSVCTSGFPTVIRRLRQTWLVLWQIALGRGLKLTWESICCAYHTEKSQDLMIWVFWLVTRCRGWHELISRVLTTCILWVWKARPALK